MRSTGSGMAPSPSSAEWIQMHGLDTYIDQQLTPLTWNDEGDYRMRSASEELFTLYRPGHDTYLIVDGDRWDLKKGTEAPPYQWNQPGFEGSLSQWLAQRAFGLWLLKL